MSAFAVYAPAPAQRWFGSILRAARRAKGWTLGDLARTLGIRVPAASDLERGYLVPCPGDAVFEGIRQHFPADCYVRLVEAAAMARERWELPTRVSPARDVLGAALAARWRSLTDDEISALTEILTRGGR